MEASKVIITDQTRAQASNPLNLKQREELKIELVKQYILRKPYGTRIKTREFGGAMQIKSTGAIHNFIKRLVEEGVIVRHEKGPRSFFYTVPGEVKVVKPADAMTAPAPPPASVEKPVEAPKATQPQRVSGVDLETQAMRYMFYSNNCGTVPGFLLWLKEEVR